MLSMPKGCGAEICSAAMRFRMTLGVGFLRSRLFHFFRFFLANRDSQKKSLSTRGDYFQFPKFPCKHIKRGSCPATANFNLNFAFWGPAFADVALRCLLRCGFALVLQGLASVQFHNVCPVVACFSTSLGGVCWWGGGGRGSLRSSKCCCCLFAIVFLSGWVRFLCSHVVRNPHLHQ